MSNSTMRSARIINKRRLLQWLAGAIIIFVVYAFAGRAITRAVVVQVALQNEDFCRIESILCTTRDIGGLPASTTLALLKHKRIEVRQAAASALSYTNDIKSISGEIWALTDDSDPLVRHSCLCLLVCSGDKKAFLKVVNILKKGEPNNTDTRFAVSGLSGYGVREAGDELVRLFELISKKEPYAMYLYRMLERKGVLKTENKMAVYNIDDLPLEESTKLLDELKELWRKERLNFKPAAEFSKRELIREVELGAPSNIHMLYYILLVLLQAIWAVGYLTYTKFASVKSADKHSN